jgi:hypothetical protein
MWATLSFLPCIQGSSDSTDSNITQEQDPFELLTSLINKSLPSSIPRPISPIASYKCSLTTLSMLQIAGGLSHCFADLYSGTYATLLGILGFNTGRSDRHPDLFKTYLVITFINGCVQGMDVFGNALIGHYSLGLAGPFLLSNAIAYLGWLFVKKQKRLLRDPGYLSVWRARNYELVEKAFVEIKSRSHAGRLATILEEEEIGGNVRVAGTGESGENLIKLGA